MDLKINTLNRGNSETQFYIILLMVHIVLTWFIDSPKLNSRPSGVLCWSWLPFVFVMKGRRLLLPFNPFIPQKANPLHDIWSFMLFTASMITNLWAFLSSTLSIMSLVVLSHGLDAGRPHLPFRYIKYILKFWEQHFEPIKKM